MTWEGKPSYYQIGYRKYTPGTKVQTFTMEQLQNAKETMRQVAGQLTTKSNNADGKVITQDEVVLKPEESVSLTLEPKNSKVITKLLVQLAAENYQQALRSTVVTMTFDDERTAWIPVGSLGGVGYSKEKNDTFYIKTDPENRRDLLLLRDALPKEGHDHLDQLRNAGRDDQTP